VAAGGTGFVWELEAGFGADAGAGACAAAKLTRSNALHRNGILVKHGARMQWLPAKYCIKRSLERARRIAAGVSAKEVEQTEVTEGPGMNFLDMANKKRNNGRASR